MSQAKGVVTSNGKRGVSDLESSLSTSPPPKNFFDFDEEKKAEVDIWGSNFTATLRHGSETFESMPFVPDSQIDKIGEAFVEEERSLKPTFRRNVSPFSENDGVKIKGKSARFRTADPVMSLPPSTGPSMSLPAVSSNVSEAEHVLELESKIQELEEARWRPPTISETINRLLLGKTCSLSWYKSMEEKKALLDAAIATYEGNTIMAIILFIKKTVDESIMLNVLERRPVAAQHYIGFLKKLKNWKELRALYRRLKKYDELCYFSLQECEAPGIRQEERIKRIKNCPIQFKNLRLQHSEDVQYVEEYSRLINKQLRIEEAAAAASHGGAKTARESVLFTPLTTTLLYCCIYYRNQDRHTGSPEELCKLFNIHERQYFQMDLLALARKRDWEGVDSILTTKGVLGFSKKKKSPIGFERVVRLLGQDRFKAPERVLSHYLVELDDLEVRYGLAMEVGAYDTALDTLKEIKDRERVQGFINFIPPNQHSQFRYKVEKILSNSQIKWKT